MSSDSTSVHSSRMTRRSAFRALAGMSAAFAVATLGAASAEHTAQQYTVSVNANLRTGPGTGYGIITVIRKGATFTINGRTENGFASITYQGRSGWVYAAFIVPAGDAGDPVIVGEARTTANVNLRSGPGTGHQVLHVVTAGTWVKTTETTQNGYRNVVHNGQAGWIADQYLDWPRDAPSDDQGGNERTTTANLNLRAEPSTSAPILTVIPAGRRVQLLHTQAGAFLNVNYNGLQGWVHKDYLR
jgi:uncharacterized protein YraI